MFEHLDFSHFFLNEFDIKKVETKKYQVTFPNCKCATVFPRTVGMLLPMP